MTDFALKKLTFETLKLSFCDRIYKLENNSILS